VPKSLLRSGNAPNRSLYGTDTLRNTTGASTTQPSPNAIAATIAAAIAAMNPDQLIPMHCPVEAFIANAMQEMPAKVLCPSIGTRLLYV